MKNDQSKKGTIFHFGDSSEGYVVVSCLDGGNESRPRVRSANWIMDQAEMMGAALEQFRVVDWRNKQRPNVNGRPYSVSQLAEEVVGHQLNIAAGGYYYVFSKNGHEVLAGLKERR